MADRAAEISLTLAVTVNRAGVVPSDAGVNCQKRKTQVSGRLKVDNCIVHVAWNLPPRSSLFWRGQFGLETRATFARPAAQGTSSNVVH